MLSGLFLHIKQKQEAGNIPPLVCLLSAVRRIIVMTAAAAEAAPEEEKNDDNNDDPPTAETTVTVISIAHINKNLLFENTIAFIWKATVSYASKEQEVLICAEKWQHKRDSGIERSGIFMIK